MLTDLLLRKRDEVWRGGGKKRRKKKKQQKKSCLMRLPANATMGHGGSLALMFRRILLNTQNAPLTCSESTRRGWKWRRIDSIGRYRRRRRGPAL